MLKYGQLSLNYPCYPCISGALVLTLVMSSSSSILISILMGVLGKALNTSRNVGIVLSSHP